MPISVIKDIEEILITDTYDDEFPFESSTSVRLTVNYRASTYSITPDRGDYKEFGFLNCVSGKAPMHMSLIRAIVAAIDHADKLLNNKTTNEENK